MIYAVADYLSSIEADESHNDKERTAIETHAAAYGGEAWLGLMNAYSGRKGAPTHERWDGELVRNFGADFVIPRFDGELDRLLLERDAAPYEGVRDDSARVGAIIERVHALGGRMLVWT
jgi:hypothetical protein